METQKKYFQGTHEFIKKNTKLFFGTLIVITLLIGSIVFFYTAPRDKTWVRNITQVMPYPIIWVDGAIITERALAENMDSTKRFYQNQDFSSLGLRVDFSTEEGKKRLQVRERGVLNKMVEDVSFKAIAKKKNIKVTEDEVKNDIKSRLDTYGTGSEVESNLNRLYGWSVKDFAQKVVTPSLYQSKLHAVYEDEVDQASAKQKIEAAEKELSASVSFADVARKYSEGNTGQNGGTLGWFQLVDLVPELQDTVKNALPGSPSAIIESSLGFHIILVEETKADGEVTLYRLSQIFVKKISFSDWLTEQMQSLNIFVWSPFYSWNQERAQVDFATEAWQQFEQSVYENSTQDALFVN